MKNHNVFPQISRTDTRDAFAQRRSAPLASDIVETVLGGLTKRELLAAMAMQGLLSQGERERFAELAKEDAIPVTSVIAIMSCEFADALIAELDK